MQKEDDWSPNPFWDTLFIILKSADLKFFLFADHLPASLLNQWESVSDLKEICAQSWGHIEAFRHIISPKTSLQQPCSWVLIYPITLYLHLTPAAVFNLKYSACNPRPAWWFYSLKVDWWEHGWDYTGEGEGWDQWRRNVCQEIIVWDCGQVMTSRWIITAL